MKGKSIWQVQKEYNDSWTWKTLLDLRCKVRNNICKVIRNGRKTNMWQDQWSTIGILSDTVTVRSIHNARFPDNMTERLKKYPVLASLEVPELNSQKEDSTMWKSINGSLVEFSSKAAWKLLSQQNTSVNWNKVVWYTQCNPRMAFILWMAIKGRLQTQDKNFRLISLNNTRYMCA
ncbi:RNA-directed DNA polymerase, eukaryota, Reverse transcriptase zinc-binding domain protein [Artemisia annua]|uniref:RNA-directed DNA polymerase, eukaryota, Reverse transcriptase zinc-binding domain protein n=1 Tax=Artemisia annua TaxID=35608 RepID=A0A2U1Q0T1_ARTAN|nr:RNA-directed DNA polymerase, eukaryota, Reverse transcriptase zinc-binding domain protein [Artemisia annua]